MSARIAEARSRPLVFAAAPPSALRLLSPLALQRSVSETRGCNSCSFTPRAHTFFLVKGFSEGWGNLCRSEGGGANLKTQGGRGDRWGEGAKKRPKERDKAIKRFGTSAPRLLMVGEGRRRTRGEAGVAAGARERGRRMCVERHTQGARAPSTARKRGARPPDKHKTGGARTRRGLLPRRRHAAQSTAPTMGGPSDSAHIIPAAHTKDKGLEREVGGKREKGERGREETKTAWWGRRARGEPRTHTRRLGRPAAGGRGKTAMGAVSKPGAPAGNRTQGGRFSFRGGGKEGEKPRAQKAGGAGKRGGTKQPRPPLTRHRRPPL